MEDSDMMSPGTAHASLKFEHPSISRRPDPPRRLALRLLAEHKRIKEILALLDRHHLGSMSVNVPFSRAPFTSIAAESFVAFEELVIVTGSSALLVHSAGGRCFLMGNKGYRNDCAILFRHAYGKVTCDLSTTNLGADTHVGFVTHGTFKEAWHADFAKQPAPRMPGREDWSSLQCSQTELNELQGLVWRGGTLCIERIALEP
ncbi:hypothetical protein FIV34_18775 [Luteibacter pinisoli]|uniref:Uncharacterized protein n=1 Tax=Luteibacter pinisoli TaxID=2589080 RepID=A0A4Y5Z6L1_9GAMM|nr:hypothetical protein [Luteibacter pinisoli]QDE41102.1 hypothetical protein FIV34_18775 [Luteibacter pinisoli]